MTDEPDSVDELISRYLDGEATDEEISRVESDPALLARAESMRAAMEAVAAPVAIPTDALDRIRATALAASGTSTAVTDLDARRRTLERRNRIMAIAAAFVFLALGAGAVVSLSGGGDDDSDASSSLEVTTADDAAESSQSASASGLSTAGESDADDSGDDMADDGDMAAEMAEEDDMAEEEADTVEEDDMAEEDTADDTEAAADPEEFTPNADDRVSFDVLPDELGDFPDVSILNAVVDASYGESPEARSGVLDNGGEPFLGLCDEAIAAITTNQPGGTLSVEAATATVDGELVTVLAAVDEAASLVVLYHPIDDCAAVGVASADAP